MPDLRAAAEQGAPLVIIPADLVVYAVGGLLAALALVLFVVVR